MRFAKVYIEISNLCNLSCRFCPGTKRPKGRMDLERFSSILEKLKGYTEFVYFHLMGEPLLHPDLPQFLDVAGKMGFKVILTTNGTLLEERKKLLLSSPAVHKVNISLHAFEANDLSVPFETYVDGCLNYGKAAEGKKLTVFRLWNSGGEDKQNGLLLQKLEEVFPKPWKDGRKGTQLASKVYLEPGEKFDWPDLNAPEEEGPYFCYGLRDQIGILWDGTVVPCCLDHEGDIPLGNILTQTMEEILESDRAKAIYDGFSKKEAAEPLCRRCGYARRFK
jgi:radical SAM protein with 4Fe4S-binding SPASM domain